MIASVFHTNGQAYDLPVSRIVVYNDAGQPVAVSYVEDGYIAHCDVGHADWVATCKRLGIKERSWTPPSVSS